MNEKRYARITPQAVMKDFPIGTIINFGTMGYWKYNNIEKVDGYIFDGEYWYPAQNSWDGWRPLFGSDEDEETYEPPQNSDADLMWMKDIV